MPSPSFSVKGRFSGRRAEGDQGGPIELPTYRWPRTRRSNRVARRRGMQLAPMFAKAPPLGQRRPLCRMEPRNRAFANFLSTSSARRDAHAPARRLSAPSRPSHPVDRHRRDELHLRKEAAARLGLLDATANGKPAPLDQYGHSSFTLRFAIPRYAPRTEHPGARVVPRPSADAGERDP